MKKKTKTSHHASRRIKERCGVGKHSADRVTCIAYERGIDRQLTKGSLRKWLDRRYTCKDGIIKVWGDKAYIYSDQRVLITVIQIPANLTQKMKKMIVTAA